MLTVLPDLNGGVLGVFIGGNICRGTTGYIYYMTITPLVQDYMNIKF